MDMRDQLKSMLNNMINDNPDQASFDLHNYLTMKMREVAGLTKAPTPTPNIDDENDPE